MSGSGFQQAFLPTLLRDVETALRGGDMARAMQLSSDAVAKGIDDPRLLTLAAHQALAKGDAAQALEIATRARGLSPRNPDVLNTQALALARLGRQREALSVYDAALRQAPAAGLIHFNKGCALEELNEVARAQAAFERCLMLAPAHVEAQARLANLAVLRGDNTRARRHGEAALKRDPGNAMAIIALAQADVEEKTFDAAVARLSPLAQPANPSALNRAIAQGLLGDALDGLDRTDEAFAAYSASNAILKTLYAAQFGGAETALQRASRLIGYFSSAEPETWQARGGHSERTHVFLIGFPRSGTTLLEQVLASHSAIESLEERDCLIDAANDFIHSAEALDRLAGLDDAALEPYREAYWRRVGEGGFASSRAVFIDKMPLNTVLLFLIARLFPKAKILFALRDPRDVVWSCFRRRFVMNAQMYEFLTLEGAAAYYDAVMQLGGIFQDKLGLDTHILRYEDMVGDFEGAVRTLCAFLGVEFQDSMHDFAKTAARRAIATPSAAQVARGLFTQGHGQWQRYARDLAPILPTLAPWVENFRYDRSMP